MTAERLVEDARAYSQEAWAALYDGYYPRIYQYCVRRTGQLSAAEDIAADVFLEALRGIHRYQHRGVPVIAWFYRIARNLTADYLRRSARQPTVPLPDADRSGLHQPDAADRLGVRRDVELALAQLTRDQREVILLRFFEGLSHEETATVMRRRVGAVRVLQYRALGALRGLITP